MNGAKTPLILLGVVLSVGGLAFLVDKYAGPTRKPTKPIYTGEIDRRRIADIEARIGKKL